MPIQKLNSPSQSASSTSTTSSSSSEEAPSPHPPPSPPPPRSSPSGKKAIPQKPKPKLKTEPISTPAPPQGPSEDSADGRKPPDSEESEFETDTGSSSESDDSPEKSEPRKSLRTVKPISSKPMNETHKSKKPVKVATKPTLASPSKSTPPKRPPQANKDEKESKKQKKSEEEEDASKKSVEDPKKQLFQRFWSEEDEIVILKGLVEYLKEATDLGDFYEYVKKSFHVEVNRNQLLDKIRRLKKKYQNNVIKSAKNGKDPSFTKPHEQKAYDLSKKIWGTDQDNETNDAFGGNNSEVTKKSHKGNNTVPASPNNITVARKENHSMDKAGNLQNGFLYSCLDESKINLNFFGSSSESILKRGLDLIDSSKAKELEEKWKKLQMMEMELYLKRVDLVREQTKLILEALKSSGP